jgi:hypothetical protein
MILLGKYKLNRRAVLRGAGTVAIALPWLEIMGADKAYAAAAPAKRLLTVCSGRSSSPSSPTSRRSWPSKA